MMNLTKTLVWMAATAVVLSGCSSDDNKSADKSDFFKGDAHGERVERFATIQAANGARNDAMLYGSQHFTAGHLNSLGRQKVLLMLEDCDSCDPIVVHLVNCGEGDLLAQRKAAVELYLKTTEGPNQLTFHPASSDLIRFNKTESGKAGEGNAAETETAGGGIGLSAAGAPGQ